MTRNNDPLDARWHPAPTPQLDLFSAMRRQIRVLVLLPLFFSVLSFGYLVIKPSTYAASAVLEFDTAGLRPDDVTSILTTHMIRIRSEETGRRVIERLGLDFGEISNLQPGRLERVASGIRTLIGLQTQSNRQMSEEDRRRFIARQVAGTVLINRVSLSDQLSLTYTAATPEQAAMVANTFAEVYLEFLEERARRQGESQADFLRSRIEAVHQLAAVAFQEAFEARASSNPDMAVPGYLDSQINRLVGARSELDQAIAEIEVQLSFLTDAESGDLERLEAAAASVSGGLTLFDSFVAASTRLEDLLQREGTSASTAQLEASITRSREALYRMLRLERRTLERALAVVIAQREHIISQLETALRIKAQEDQPSIRIAEHQGEVLRRIYADYIEQVEATYEISNTIPAQISSLAIPPISSTTSQRVILLVAMALGLILAAVIASFREWYAADQLARHNSRTHEMS